MHLNPGFIAAVLAALGGPVVRSQTWPIGSRRPGTRAHRRWRRTRAAGRR